MSEQEVYFSAAKYIIYKFLVHEGVKGAEMCGGLKCSSEIKPLRKLKYMSSVKNFWDNENPLKMKFFSVAWGQV